MRTTLRGRPRGVLLIFLLAMAPLRAQPPSPELRTFLRQRLQFNAQEIGDVGKGKAVARILPSEKQEVAIAIVAEVLRRARAASVKTTAPWRDNDRRPLPRIFLSPGQIDL
jgi:hypothetical protein